MSGPAASAPPRTDRVISEERFGATTATRASAASTGCSTLVARSSSSRPSWSGSASRATVASTSRHQGRADRRLEPPQLPRPVRDRRDAPLAAADAVRRQGRALRAALAGLDALAPRRLPDPPRPVRRDRDGDRGASSSIAAAPSASSPRAPASGRARSGTPKRGVGRLALETGAAVLPVAVHGSRAGPPRLADPPAQGQAARRRADDVPAHRAPVARPRRDRHRPDLAEHRASVGVARRPATAAQGGGDRRRQLGHRDGRPPRARRARGPARHAHRGEGRARSAPSARTSTYLPGVPLPENVSVRRAADIELAGWTWSASPSPPPRSRRSSAGSAIGSAPGRRC